jgi:hypothetical protein
MTPRAATKCADCDALMGEIVRLEEENRKLLAALRREAHHIEEPRIHHKDEIADMRRWLGRK